MSLWADREILKLIRRCDELEKRVSSMEKPSVDVDALIQTFVEQEPQDKRTREWKEWKTRNS